MVLHPYMLQNYVPFMNNQQINIFVTWWITVVATQLYFKFNFCSPETLDLLFIIFIFAT